MPFGRIVGLLGLILIKKSNFLILISDLGCLQKSIFFLFLVLHFMCEYKSYIIVKCSSFYHILISTQLNLTSNSKCIKMKNWLFYWFFHFDLKFVKFVLIKIWKKVTLFYNTFLQAILIWNQNWKILTFKIYYARSGPFRARLLSDFLLLNHFWPQIHLSRPETGLTSLCNHQKVDFDIFLNFFSLFTTVLWFLLRITSMPE